MKTSLQTLLMVSAALLPLASAQTPDAAPAPCVADALSPAARDAVRLEKLLELLQKDDAVANSPGLRPVYLWLEETGGFLRCVDMNSLEAPLKPSDYELSLRPELMLYPWVDDMDDEAAEEEDDEEEPPAEVWKDACLAQLKACYQELPAVLEQMKRSKEIPEGLAAEAESPENDVVLCQAFLAELGLVAVNDARNPWRWAASFFLPSTGGGSYIACPFILQDGQWEQSERYLCYYFGLNDSRQLSDAGKSRLNCLFPPELTDKGRELCREYARYKEGCDNLHRQRAEILRSVQNLASANEAVEPLKRIAAAEKELCTRYETVVEAFLPDEDEESSPWHKGLTREEFAPENMLQGDDVLQMHGLSGDDEPYWAFFSELERLDEADCYGSEALRQVLKPEWYFED